MVHVGVAVVLISAHRLQVREVRRRGRGRGDGIEKEGGMGLWERDNRGLALL